MQASLKRAQKPRLVRIKRKKLNTAANDKQRYIEFLEFPHVSLSDETMRSRRNLIVYSCVAMLIFLFDIEVSSFSLSPVQVNKISSRMILYIMAAAIFYQLAAFSTRAREDIKLWNRKMIVWLAPLLEANKICQEGCIALGRAGAQHSEAMGIVHVPLYPDFRKKGLFRRVTELFWFMDFYLYSTTLNKILANVQEFYHKKVRSRTSTILSYLFWDHDSRTSTITNIRHILFFEIIVPLAAGVIALGMVLAPEPLSAVKAWVTSIVKPL